MNSKDITEQHHVQYTYWGCLEGHEHRTKKAAIKCIVATRKAEREIQKKDKEFNKRKRKFWELTSKYRGEATKVVQALLKGNDAYKFNTEGWIDKYALKIYKERNNVPW